MATNRPTYNSYNTKLTGKEPNTMSRSSYETNPVGALQERFQSRGITPQYRVVQAEGASHAPTFSFQVILGDLTATGSGSSKKQAKVRERERNNDNNIGDVQHSAARAMLDKLDGRVPAQDGKLCIVNYVICPVTKKKIVAERIIFREGAKPSEIGFESPEFLLDNQESGRHSLANTTSPNLL